ncbi:hypothetical protein MASR2M78_01440 [Treponema sp.]
MMKKAFLFLGLFLALQFLSAQNNKHLVAILPFSQTDSGEAETRTLEHLIESYISEIEGIQLLQVKDSYSADYLISGSLTSVGNNRVLNLEMVAVKSGEKRSVSAVHRSMSDLVLGTRALVQGLLGLRPEQTESEESRLPLNEDLVYGTWHGDAGLESIRIFKGGRAAAIFSSGVRMDLSYQIKNDEIILSQVSPNMERYYYPVPYKVAKELVKMAEPMRWVLHALARGTVLRGIKISSAVRYEKDSILEIIHNSIGETEWTKLEH